MVILVHFYLNGKSDFRITDMLNLPDVIKELEDMGATKIAVPTQEKRTFTGYGERPVFGQAVVKRNRVRRKT